MVGSNCALYGCPTSRTDQFAILKIPVVGAADGEETAAKKRNAREEWLRIILRTREKTPDHQKQIDGNKIFICERHFKPECNNNNNNNNNIHLNIALNYMNIQSAVQ